MDENNNIIDLFCGCGGFGLGAELAGFNCVLSVDIDQKLSASYPLNFSNSNLKNYDLSKISSSQLIQDSGPQEVTGVIGGPPCQGFSVMGRRQEDDPRNQLIKYFFMHVMNIQPKFFIMENVPGLLNGPMSEMLESQLKFVARDFKIVGPIILDASKMGTATKRKRVLVIGYKEEYFENFHETDLLNLYSENNVTVFDAISDLPEPVDSMGDDYGWAKLDGRKKVSKFAERARTLPPKNLGWQTAVEKLKENTVSGLMNTVHNDRVSLRFKDLIPGTADKISKAPKLKWSGLAPTLRAGTGSDKGSYQAVRPIHPGKGRVITVREAARLQGFPDWFVFHPTKWHSFRMIGNSVSPYLSEAVLSFVKSKMQTA